MSYGACLHYGEHQIEALTLRQAAENDHSSNKRMYVNKRVVKDTLSPITHGSSSSSSTLSSLSPLASSLSHSVFHSELKTWLLGKTFSFLTGLILWTLGPFNVFILLNGWICLHGVLD